MGEFELAALCEGASGIVRRVEARPDMAHRLMDLGVIPGTRVTCVAESPAGDPRAYLIRGAVIALRQADARDIFWEQVP